VDKKITVQITPFNILEKAILAEKWQELSTYTNESVFLSWEWIASWLDIVINDELFLIEANENDQIVGLGVFVEKRRKVFGLFPIVQWFLHRTGDIHQDQIWIEHNDFLLADDVADEVRLKMIESLFQSGYPVQEYIIGLSVKEVLTSYEKCFQQSTTLIDTLGYKVDFALTGDNYLLKCVSKNTRGQIRRSEKLLMQQGLLDFQVIVDKHEVKKIIPDIARIHIARWDNTEEGSGFNNPLFNRFHNNFLAQAKRDEVQIAVLSLNNSNIAYLLNFVINNKVYFYLSAIDKSADKKIKIGLLLHSKAIQYYLEQGMSSYDFLGGDARYKQSLANQKYALTIKGFFKNNLILKLEKSLKNIKLVWKLKLSK